MTFLPLSGVQVVDVTTSLAGPYCTELLAALGADVIKVEPPGGDEARFWGPPFWEGESTLFLTMNAGKRSICVDLRRGREVMQRLAEQADVFIQSLRPGLAEERGLGANELRALNPRLVYCSIGAFGNPGPLARDPGYDPLVQAFSGIVSVTGEHDRPGVRVGVSVVDQTTGLWASLAIVAALHAGGGQILDLSLYESAVSLMGYHLTGYLVSGETPGRHGTAFPLIAPYQVFPTRDGELMIAVANDRLFAVLCDALDLPVEERFATNPQRVERRGELAELLSGRLQQEDTATWLARLRRAGVPAAPVQDAGAVADHEQTQALGLLQELGGAPIAAPPVSIDGERVLHRTPAPQLGAHTADVLAEVGYSEEEIAELVASGAVRLGNSPAR